MYDQLNLFSVRAYYKTCEYGSLFIVAAKDPTTAKEMVENRLIQYFPSPINLKIDSCEQLGTTTLFEKQRVVDQFTT